MASADDGGAPDEGGGSGERIRNRIFRTENNEEPQNVSQEPGQFNSSGVSELSTHQGWNYVDICAAIGISELEQILKQKTFTRYEILCLIKLLQSRITEESPSDIVVVESDGANPLPPPSSPSLVIRLEASTSDQLKKHKHADKSDSFHASVVDSRVLGEQIDSPAGLPKSYNRSTIGKEVSELFNNNSTCFQKTPMASPQRPTTMENLPDELLVNIFIRLLAKHLAQMRSVSKSWNALLSQSSFIKSHLHHSRHNKNQILLAFYDDVLGPSKFKPFTAHMRPSPHLEVTTSSIKLPARPIFEYETDFSVIGCVNGLICSSYNDSVIHIWNPSLSTVFLVPPYYMPSHDYGSIKIYFRFGFDPKTDDYKLVKLTGLTEPPKHDIKRWLQVEIYSMRKGHWELITDRFPSRIRSIDHYDYVCVDGHYGHLHWLGHINERSDSERIVAFDLGSHTFREIPLPDFMVVPKRCNQIGVLAKKLCVMSHVVGRESEIWVMDEYGVAESWVKRHVFSHFIGHSFSVGFTSHDEFLVVRNDRVVFYDPIANKETILENDVPTRSYPRNIVEYVDSLVWITPPGVRW